MASQKIVHVGLPTWVIYMWQGNVVVPPGIDSMQRPMHTTGSGWNSPLSCPHATQGYNLHRQPASNDFPNFDSRHHADNISALLNHPPIPTFIRDTDNRAKHLSS